MSASNNVVAISAHPKYERKIVCLDMNGDKLNLGDQYVDVTGNSGEIIRFFDDGTALVSSDQYNRSIRIDTSDLLRSSGAITRRI